MPWHHQNYCKRKKGLWPVIIALSGVFGCLDTLVKWLAFSLSVDGSRWALQSLPPRDLTAVCDRWGTKKLSQKRERGLLSLGDFSTLQLLPCSPPFRWGCSKRLWLSHHRKWNVELQTAQWQRNPWSLFLSTYTPTHNQTACKNSV